MSGPAYPRVVPAGDRAVSVEFGGAIDPAANDGAVALARSLGRRPINGVTETVVSYRSLLVMYEPERVSQWRLRRMLARRAGERREASAGMPNYLYEIPVRYGGEYGVDLADVAAHHHIAETDVVRLHAAPAYRVFMLGFMPGFPYLGGLEDTIATPRLDTPRAMIPAGSVGIGGSQTGVYPLDSPGGWRLIGRTPVRLFDAAREPAVLLRAGDGVRFVPVDDGEYARISEAVNAGAYETVRRAWEDGAV